MTTRIALSVLMATLLTGVSSSAQTPGGQAPVVFRPADIAKHPEVRFIASDVVNVRKPSHHDPEKLARTIMRKVWQA